MSVIGSIVPPSGRLDNKSGFRSSASPTFWTSTPQHSINAGAQKAQPVYEEEFMAAGSTVIPYGAENATTAKSAIVLLGRLFFAAIFLMAGPGHFGKQAIGYAASQGVPLAWIAVPVSGLLAIAGGLSILLGYRAKIGA